MELPPVPDEDQVIAEDEVGSGNPTDDGPERSPAQVVQASQRSPEKESQTATEGTNRISPSQQRLLDKADEAWNLLQRIEHRMQGGPEKLFRSRSSTEQRTIDAIERVERTRSTPERRMMLAAEDAATNSPDVERCLRLDAEDSQRNRAAIERYFKFADDEARRNRSAVERLFGTAAEDERRIRSTWDQRIMEASEPLRILNSSLQQRVLMAGGLFPMKPLLDQEQILKLASLSIGVGQSLSSVLSKSQQSSLLNSVGELERFRELQAAVQPPFASLGAFNVDSVARLSPASLGFSTALFSEIQQYTGSLGTSFSKAVTEMARVTEVWEEWDRQMDLHAGPLGELGWTYPMNLTPHQLSRIVQCEDAEKLDEEFVEFYNYNDGESFAELCEEIMKSDHLTPWHALLTECVDCHKDRRFVVSATCLISALEGAITKRSGGRLNQKQLTKFFNDRIQEAGKDRMEAAMWKSIAAFVKQLFANSDFSGDAPARINRHWILHGKAVPPGREADSLRFFQAIHTVSVIYDSLNPNHGA